MLAEGAIRALATGGTESRSNPFNLQVLNFKKMTSSSTQDRYRLIVSDGVHTNSSVMLGTQLNHLIENQNITANAVIAVDKHVVNHLQPGKSVLILFDVRVIQKGEQIGHKIGTPQPITSVITNQTVSNNAPEQGKTFLNTGKAPKTPLANKTNIPMAFGSPGGGGTIQPIMSLNPYQHKWTIKCRVTNRSGIRTYSNAKGNGKLFSFEVSDSSGEIRVTGFNEQVDKFYDMLSVGRTILLSGCQVKPANKQFNKLNHDYELTLTQGTIIELGSDVDDAEVPQIVFNYISIEKLDTVVEDSLIDLIAVVKETEDVTQVTSKSTSKTYDKRELILIDDTEKTVRLTLWGDEAVNFDGSTQPVIALKNVKVSSFNGRSLGTLQSSTIVVNPDNKRAHFLKGWFNQIGHNVAGESLSTKSNFSTKFYTFQEAVDAKLGMNEKPDYYNNKASVVFIKKENALYKGCQQCKKKLIDDGNEFFRCEKCNQSGNEFTWYLNLSVNLSDHTDSVWTSLFGEQAEKLLGKSAQELGQLHGNDDAAYEEVFTTASFKSYIFTIRAKMDNWNDEMRIRHTVQSVSPIDPISYGRKLLKDLDTMIAA